MMASTVGMTSDQIHSRVTAMLASARSLIAEIAKAAPGHPLNGGCLFDIEALIEQLAPLACLPVQNRQEVDEVGTELWNICGRTSSVRLDNQLDQKILSRAKTVAFIFIDAMAPNSMSGNLRGLKAALSAAQSCIDNKQSRLAHRILGSGAQRLDALQKSDKLVEQSRLEGFMVEYWTLRAYLAYLQCRPDVADHLLSQVSPEGRTANPKVVIEICYHIGSHAMSIRQYDQAVAWLSNGIEQMQNLCQSDCAEKMGLKNLDLVMRHTLARVYGKLDTDEARDECAKHLEILKKEHQDALAVKFLELETICDESNRGVDPNINQFFEVLTTIIDSVNFTHRNFLFVFGFIKSLRSFSQGLSLKALQSMIPRLPIENTVLVETGFTHITHFVIQTQVPEETRLAFIKTAAETLEKHGVKPLSTEAAHASLIIIWKHVDLGFRQCQYSTAGGWCQLVLDTNLLRNCSEANKFKVQKKLALCALRGEDLALAHKAIDGMSIWHCLGPGDVPTADPQILFFKYELALQERQGRLSFLDYLAELASESTPSILQDDRFSFLRMYAIEDQSLGNSPAAMTYAREFIAQVQSNQQAGQMTQVNEFLFPLLLLTGELKQGHLSEANVALTLQLLKLGLPEARRKVDEGNLFTDDQLEWICRASYCLAHKLLEAHQADCFTDDFTEVFQEALSTTREYLLLRKSRSLRPEESIDRTLMLTSFLSVAWHAISIRSGRCDNEEMRARYKAINAIAVKVRNFHLRRDEETKDIFRNIFALGFEANMATNDWTGVIHLYHQSLTHMNETMFAQVLESILRMRMPHTHRVFVLLEMVSSVNEPERATLSSRQVLPFHLRILFELCLAGNQRDQDLGILFKRVPIPKATKVTLFTVAELVLGQAITIAEDEMHILSDEHRQMHAQDPEHSVCGQFPYPKAELIHLASLAFNQAMDFYSTGRDAECQSWAQKAIRLATLVRDVEGDALAADLRARLSGLD